jgi:hypothetical protein
MLASGEASAADASDSDASAMLASGELSFEPESTVVES